MLRDKENGRRNGIKFKIRIFGSVSVQVLFICCLNWHCLRMRRKRRKNEARITQPFLPTMQLLYETMIDTVSTVGTRNKE